MLLKNIFKKSIFVYVFFIFNLCLIFSISACTDYGPCQDGSYHCICGGNGYSTPVGVHCLIWSDCKSGLYCNNNICSITPPVTQPTPQQQICTPSSTKCCDSTTSCSVSDALLTCNSDGLSWYQSYVSGQCGYNGISSPDSPILNNSINSQIILPNQNKIPQNVLNTASDSANNYLNSLNFSLIFLFLTLIFSFLAFVKKVSWTFPIISFILFLLVGGLSYVK